jgi:GTP-binding protein
VVALYAEIEIMEIKEAEFVKSSQNNDQCPEDGKPEYAFIGRSNVGKSSLINMLMNRKKLAKTSGTPGKTQLINHFVVDGKWYVVDLPGYGYAKVSKGDRKGFQKLITDYLAYRKTLVTVFLLIDARHEPQKIDLEFMRWLGETQVPFCLVFTKIDKCSSTELSKNMARYKKRLLADWQSLPPIFTSSATSKIGRMELLGYINGLNQAISLS